MSVAMPFGIGWGLKSGALLDDLAGIGGATVAQLAELVLDGRTDILLDAFRIDRWRQAKSK
jgi:hypothetical protein